MSGYPSFVDALPEIINQSILKRGAKISFSWEQLAPPRPGHNVVTPKSRWWLARRAVFVWFWSRLEAWGLRRHFLEYGSCYECSGTVEATEHIEDERWVDA